MSLDTQGRGARLTGLHGVVIGNGECRFSKLEMFSVHEQWESTNGGRSRETGQGYTAVGIMFTAMVVTF